MLKSIAFAFLFLGAGLGAARAGERNVVLILIDGLPAYLLDDPQASLPVIRGLAKEGATAEGGMRVSDPSVTWPNQTSIVTGNHADRHGVLFNGALDDAGARGRTAVFIVADHGFIATPKSLRPNAILRREGLLAVKGGRIVSRRVLAVPEGGITMVYLTDPATAPQDREAVIRLFREAEGIAAIVEPKMNAIFVAAGAGIKAGTKVPTVANIDVAPTIARLLGTSLKNASGRVLEEILVAPN